MELWWNITRKDPVYHYTCVGHENSTPTQGSDPYYRQLSYCFYIQKDLVFSHCYKSKRNVYTYCSLDIYCQMLNRNKTIWLIRFCVTIWVIKWWLGGMNLGMKIFKDMHSIFILEQVDMGKFILLGYKQYKKYTL